MKKSLFSLVTLAALFAFLFTTALHAADPKAKPTPFVPHHTVIGSISADSITINTFTGSKTYKIDKFTTITLLGNDAKTSDLKPGMKVSVTVGSDPAIAASISASNPPKDPPAAAAATKK
ncbi:MAG: hypothetical protein WCD79_10845 [Chthoniobacteraceae bacterium]